MSTPKMDKFEVMPRSLQEISPEENRRDNQPAKALPNSAAAGEDQNQDQLKPQPETVSLADPKKSAKKADPKKEDQQKRRYNRRRPSAKSRGYGYKGFIVKDDYYNRFNELREAMREKHGEEAGIILINEALEMLFKKHKKDLQNYYEKKLSDI
jgi:hypothetical protein